MLWPCKKTFICTHDPVKILLCSCGDLPLLQIGETGAPVSSSMAWFWFRRLTCSLLFFMISIYPQQTGDRLVSRISIFRFWGRSIVFLFFFNATHSNVSHRDNLFFSKLVASHNSSRMGCVEAAFSPLQAFLQHMVIYGAEGSPPHDQVPGNEFALLDGTSAKTCEQHSNTFFFFFPPKYALVLIKIVISFGEMHLAIWEGTEGCRKEREPFEWAVVT